MKNYVLTIFASIVMVGCDSRQKEYDEAKEKNTIESYSRFIEKFEGSKEANMAENQIVSLKWLDVKQSNSAERLSDYLDRYPDSPYFFEAVVILEKEVAKSDETTELLIEYPAASLPAIVAKKRGYFASEGVAVSLKRISDSRIAVDRNNWDVVIGQPLSFLPDSPRAFSYVRLFNFQYSTSKGEPITMMIGKKTQGVEKIADLKKVKYIGASHGLISGVRELFKNEQIKWQLLVDPSGKSMETCPAAFGWSTEILPIMKRSPKSYSVLARNFECTYICDPYYWNVSIVRKSYYEKNPHKVGALLRGIDRAIGFIRENPEESKKYLVEMGYRQQYVDALSLYEYNKSNERLQLENIRKVRWKNIKSLDTYILKN